MSDLKKTIIYRLISFITLTIIILLFTGSIQFTILLTTIIESVKFIQYYLFEKGWKWKSKENT